MNSNDVKATREFIRRIERARLGNPNERRGPPAYGFALHSAPRDGSPVIMVTTQAGERLPLTPRMLRDLRDCIIRVQGNAPCILDVPHGHTAADHEPLDVVEVVAIHRPRNPDGASYTPLTSVLTPKTLSDWPAILTLDRRPEGWPP